MTEENQAEYIQLDENGDLIFFDDGIWEGTTDCCICECKPKILARYILHPKQSWDLTPYKVPGYAKPCPAPRKWWLYECSAQREHGNGEITIDGTLVGLDDKFKASKDYDAYMMLCMCCVDPTTGEASCPAPNVWDEDED